MTELPVAVKKRLAEKREDGSYIGVCGGCNEEVYARKDGILRSRLIMGSGDKNCIDGKGHRIRRFYVSGPTAWIRKWGTGPDWAQFYSATYN